MPNILSDFIIRRPEGFYCPYGDFYIDPIHPVQHAVISHAHGDHARPGHQHIYSTAGSQAFMNYRFSKHHRHHYKVVEYLKDFQLGAVQLRFIPAGHILGSAQILLVYKDVRYLYTGDFKLQEDPTCEPLQIEQADVLITETTFADPEVKHPDPVQEILKVVASPYNILLGAYALGKAQRITRLLNDHCPERKVLVHHGIFPIHQIYKSFGIELGDFEPYNRKQMKEADRGNIYLVPPMTFHSYKRAQNVVRVFASGWKRLQHQNDLSLYISDHIDWNDLLSFIDQVKPQEIWTIHGDGKFLQVHLKDQIPVHILD